MSTTELILNMLAETSTTDISKSEPPQGFAESRKIAQRGGKVAGIAYATLEAETGKSVITAKNAAERNAVVVDMIEGIDDDKKDK